MGQYFIPYISPLVSRDTVLSYLTISTVHPSGDIGILFSACKVTGSLGRCSVEWLSMAFLSSALGRLTSLRAPVRMSSDCGLVLRPVPSTTPSSVLSSVSTFFLIGVKVNFPEAWEDDGHASFFDGSSVPLKTAWNFTRSNGRFMYSLRG